MVRVLHYDIERRVERKAVRKCERAYRLNNVIAVVGGKMRFGRSVPNGGNRCSHPSC